MRRLLAFLVVFIVIPQAFSSQPELKFPFEAGKVVSMSHGYYTGGVDSHSASTDHYALDFVSSNGSGCALFREVVVAVATGKVSKVVSGKTAKQPFSSRSIADGYGNYVELDHGDGYFTRYAHLDSVDSNVQLKATIVQGYPIGKVGDTGYALGTDCGNGHAGVHLHFALFEGGQGVKPEPMSGKTGISNGSQYTSDNSRDGWAKALVGNDRWIYWKINPENPLCSSGSNHVIDDRVQGVCIQTSADSCPIDAPFMTVEDAFGGSGETPGPTPITGGTNSGSLPNLIPNNSDIENASKTKVTELHINEAGYCRMQIKNTGQADAGAFETRCFISDGSKIDNNPRDEGKEDTQSLAKGDTHTEHEDFTAPEYPGTYNAVFCVDSAKQVMESNEGDNCHDEDVFTVWSNPNVIASNVTIGGGVTILNPGDTFSVDATIQNIGESFGKTILVGYFMDGLLIGTDSIKRENLKGGGTSKVETLSQAYAPTEPGNHTLTVCADYGNRIVETNEEDNCFSVNITVNDPNPENPPLPTGGDGSDDDITAIINWYLSYKRQHPQ